MRSKYLFICILLSLTGNRLYSQNKDGKISLVVFGGVSNYAGDWNNDFFKFDSKTFDNNRIGGATLGYSLNRNFDLCLMASYGAISTFNNTNTVRYFKDYFTQANLHLKYKFGIKENAILKPYIFLGTGIVSHDNKGNPENAVNGVDWLIVTGGAGLNVRISDVVFLQYQVTYGYWGGDEHDLRDGGTYNDAHLLNTIGIGFIFSGGGHRQKMCGASF